MNYTERVQDILDAAKEIVEEADGVAVTQPALLLAMTLDERFQESCPKKLKELQNQLKGDMLTIIKAEKDTGTTRSGSGVVYDPFVTIVIKSLLPKLAAAVGSTDEKIHLSHLFVAACVTTPLYAANKVLLNLEIDKDEIYINIVNKERMEKGLEALDINEANIVELEFLGKTPKMAKRPVGTFGRTDTVVDPNAALSDEELEFLMRFAKDLILDAKKKREPFIGREDIIEQTMIALCKKKKGNPIHLGEPGIGKTAVTYGLAKRIADGKVPAPLLGSSMIELDVTALLAGTRYRGDFEERLKTILTIVAKMPKPIIFIDEIHMIIGCGSSSESSGDAGNIIKPYLTSGEIKFIGATTHKEYRRYIEKDPALVRRFQPIKIDEPTTDQAIEIIKGIKKDFEEYHKKIFTDGAIKVAVELSHKLIHDRYLPDKAIDFIDMAGAKFNVHPEFGKEIDEKAMTDIIKESCHVKDKNADMEDFSYLRALDEKIKEKVFGQGDAIDKVVDAIQLKQTGLGDTNKPLSFLFVGPSGVGKTELAKTIAEKTGIDFVRFDMSEYADKFSTSKLFGTSAGFVGYEDGGLLTNAILEKPRCVLLLDEVEKAHPDIYKTFLQIFDYGMLTDSKGRKVDFTNVIIIMTSNAGSAEVDKSGIGFNAETVHSDAMNEALNEFFSTEFRGRLSGIIEFKKLDKKTTELVVNKELDILSDKLAKRDIHVIYTKECLDAIAEKGMNSPYGAREIQNVISKEIANKLSKALINGELEDSSIMTYEGNEFKIVKETKIPKTV